MTAFQEGDRIRVTKSKTVTLQLIGQEGTVQFVYPNGDVTALMDWEARLTSFYKGEVEKLDGEAENA